MILGKAQNIADQLSNWRREFHQFPELGFQEQRTAARIAEIQRSLGSRVRTGVGRTGVVAEVGSGFPVVAVRADMDALPIQEVNSASYCSRYPGIMHACGHDAHTAVVLGTAALLAKESFKGTVRFIHQPSEESGDYEGISGAPQMIADGAMKDVELIIALHVDPASDVGNIHIASGPVSGGVDSFFAEVFGQGGHGATPHEAVDPIYIAGVILVALQGIIARRLDPFSPGVISVGSIHAGSTQNVIPDQVELTGTIRYMDPGVQNLIHVELEQVLRIAKNLGGSYNLKIETGTPPMINDPRAVELIRAAAVDILGANHILPPDDTLGAEDFGCFTELAPGAMFSLGCKISEEPRKLHNQFFDLDERCLPIGTAVLTESILRYMGRK